MVQVFVSCTDFFLMPHRLCISEYRASNWNSRRKIKACFALFVVSKPNSCSYVALAAGIVMPFAEYSGYKTDNFSIGFQWGR